MKIDRARLKPAQLTCRLCRNYIEVFVVPQMKYVIDLYICKSCHQSEIERILKEYGRTNDDTQTTKS